MIIVAGSVTINPDYREEAVQAAFQMAEATQAEPGCISYRFYEDLVQPNTIFIFEEWETEEALGQHFQSEHMQTFQQQLPKFVTGPVKVKRYNVESVTSL